VRDRYEAEIDNKIMDAIVNDAHDKVIESFLFV
jgi:hypothetical protein